MIETVGRDRPGKLSLVIGGGCCEGTAPYLFENYFPGDGAVLVCRNDPVDIWVSLPGQESVPEHASWVVDLARGVVNDSMSLESDWDCRFVLRTSEAAGEETV
ncbi:MAG TPA: DUF779 domain-containing protein [Spirochaetia bacterium]|nr:DUF779 domain-containing protein [Spirochaetia bacterium]